MSKYCKECGKELPQNSKTDSCEFHQNEKNGKTRKILEGVLGVAALLEEAVDLVNEIGVELRNWHANPQDMETAGALARRLARPKARG